MIYKRKVFPVLSNSLINLIFIAIFVLLSNHNISANETDSLDIKYKHFNELGLIEGLPADYPADVPIPMNSRAIGYLKTTEGITVSFDSKVKCSDIFSDFSLRLEMNGYKKDDDYMINSEGGLITWKKNKSEVTLMLSQRSNEDLTSVVVTYK